MSAKKLSKGEKSIVNAWNGSIKQTAEKCEMSYGYVQRIVKFDYIVSLLQKREAKEAQPTIADRQERQARWSSIARGEPQVVKSTPKLDDNDKAVLDDDQNPVMIEVYAIPSIKDQLRASELLGRSSADFIERLHVTDNSKGVPKEITDDMDQKTATNAYHDMLKPGHA